MRPHCASNWNSSHKFQTTGHPRPRSKSGPPPTKTTSKHQTSNIKGIYQKCLDINCLKCRPESTSYLRGWASPGRTPCNNAAHYCEHMLHDIPTGNAKMEKNVRRHENWNEIGEGGGGEQHKGIEWMWGEGRRIGNGTGGYKTICC